MRIVAGSARGRRLEAPRGASTRPTSDKVRQAVFNVLGQSFDGGSVLDLYAGSGAMALEALSRGVARAVCVDSGGGAVDAIRKNAQACGFGDRVEIQRADVRAALARLPAAAFTLVFIDPPYAQGPEAALQEVGRVVAPGGAVVAEHDARRPPADRCGPLAAIDRRSYGSTGISIYRRE